MALHIGFLTSEYPYEGSTRSGGIGSSIKNLAVELVRQEVNVSVFVCSQSEDRVFDENGVTIHLIKFRSYSVFTFFKYRKYIQNYINRHVIEKNIDAIEAPDWTGLTAFMSIKAPLVIRFHGSDAYFCKIENRKQKLKNFIFETLAINSADAYVSPTKFAGGLTSKIFKLQKAFTTIHNGVSLADFINPDPNLYDEGLILYMGTIIRKKGVFELPDIINKVTSVHQNAKLVLIGADSADLMTGSTSTWKLIEDQFNDNAEYLGKVHYDEVKKYIQKAHICIFPTYAETLGMVTIETMAMQKPVVNSNFGWAQEIITDGVSGFLVHPADHDKFAERILQLLNDAELCRKIGVNARERVDERFNIQKNAAQNIQLYKRLKQ